ncbi:hypothetical protein ACVIHI_001202 [Bradyrhizobium sp. USDA 4524]|uniref:hypothetical protein n=1 Tax=Bradyrhizobium TaxID=374 RepID=UPI00209DDB46|nr:MULTISPECIES: hypothetical protein [Bradyrhizobium]MCP1837426.1 hypothetical protein [Bradyrhizobium sp. USDA 4538]MCP1906444.1 hypothetical protein [Bradyrhizobium sp. USDA 4537]MCP1987900.1 hypothetical protein [Bradyrhizobium sp. USDA 4539]MCP3415194.1 hypothetical protein [Bradyrhizobium brasilense]
MARLKPLAIALGMVALLLGGSVGSSVFAAELGISPGPRAVQRVNGNCQRLQYCRGDVCQWKRVCWHGCPDRYSCAPLYGAYGPYGGRDYWAAYSYGDLRPF